MTTKLLSRYRDEVSLMEALTVFHGRQPVGFCYTPSACPWVRWRDGKAESAVADFDLSQVYEARFFDEKGELRWLRDPSADGVGRAVYLTESADGVSNEEWKELPPIDVDDGDVIESGYLLWGQVCECVDPLPGKSWFWMSTARIGTLAVPLAAEGDQPGQSVRLGYREYLGLDPGYAGEHGNMAVLEQRLLKLKVWKEGNNG